MKRKVVVITGSSSGFGLLTALAFAAEGFDVIATMRNTEKSAKLLAKAAALSLTERIDVRALDITCFDAINRFASSLQHVDILVNNAGFACAGFSEDVSVDEYRSQFETNFFGTVALTNALLPIMRAQKQGRIINVSSISGQIGFPGLSPYVASKHALEGWSECLRLELAPYPIFVSLVEPGSYQTNIWTSGCQMAEKTCQPSSAYQPLFKKIRKNIEKSQATMGNPADVAKKIVAIAKLKSPRLRYPIGKKVALMIKLKQLLPWSWWQFIVLKVMHGLE